MTFQRGDLVEHTKYGGFGLVLGQAAGEPSHYIAVDWLVLPTKGGKWVYRDRHTDYDFLTSGIGLTKIGEIKL